MNNSNYETKEWWYKIHEKKDAIFTFKNLEIGQHAYDPKINLNKISKNVSCLRFEISINTNISVLKFYGYIDNIREI